MRPSSMKALKKAPALPFSVAGSWRSRGGGVLQQIVQPRLRPVCHQVAQRGDRLVRWDRCAGEPSAVGVEVEIVPWLHAAVHRAKVEAPGAVLRLAGLLREGRAVDQENGKDRARGQCAPADHLTSPKERRSPLNRHCRRWRRSRQGGSARSASWKSESLAAAASAGAVRGPKLRKTHLREASAALTRSLELNPGAPGASVRIPKKGRRRL